MFRLISILLVCSSLAWSNAMLDALHLSTSIRAMGRGGAHIAEPYGPDALSSNPAGLAQRGSGVHFNNLDYSNAQFNRRDAVVFHRKSFGLGHWNVETPSDDLTTFAIGVARANRNGVDWGIGYHSHQYNDGLGKQSFWTSDLGVILHMNPSFDIGFSGQHVLSSEDQSIEPSFTSGILIKNKAASVKVFSDIVAQAPVNGYSDSYARFGIDVDLTQDFTVRMGGDQQYYTAGASFDLFFLSLDYAYQRPKNRAKESVFALGVKIGNARQPEAFRRKYALFKPASIAYLEINGSLASGYSSISLLGGKKVGSNDIIRLIHEANHDPDCRGYLLRIKALDADLSNIALVQEIRRELEKGRANGKNIYVYLDGWASMPSYYLASVGHVVVMPPLGAIHQLGIQYEVLKFDDFMQRFGVKYHSMNSGKYKVSSSPLTEKMGVSQRETLKGSLENVMVQLKTDIHQSRNQSLSGDIYDGRIMSSEQAQEYGLIDQVGFWRDMSAIIKEDIQASADVVLASLDAYGDDESRDYVWSPFNKIAVVEINGAIAGGKNRADVVFGGIQTGADDITHIFSKLSKDPFLKGVIIRINSPGGSVLAADQILDAVNEFKKISKKPVYASMGMVAASGGYYVALGSDQIFANGATLTGSIGVMSGFFNFHEFQKEWGISSDSLSTGKYMDAFSSSQAFTDDMKAMVVEHQQSSYHHFRSLVQESRQLTDDEANAVSQGQLLTGQEAQSVGLVDEVGSYTDAIRAMEKSLGLKSSRVVVVGRPTMRSPFSFLNFLFDQ